MGFILNLTCLLIAASVGVSAGLISYYFVLKNEKEVIASADDIYEDPDIDKVVIDPATEKSSYQSAPKNGCLRF